MKYEVVKPGDNVIELTRRVMDQNEMILESNLRVLEMLTSPMVVYTEDVHKEKDEV